MRSQLLAALGGFFRRLSRERRGNVLMIMGFSVMPLTLAAGVSVDYAKAARLQTKLNAAADAAALAAVNQPQMKDPSLTAAQTAASNMFKAQIVNLPGLIWQDSDLVITVTGTSPRNAVVSYTAQSTNAFAGLIGMRTVTIGGTSTATATPAPDIDFYLALDTSPSMALPTTTSGLAQMDTVVHCAFACHSNAIEKYLGSSIPSLIKDNANFAIVKNLSYGTVGTGSAKKQKIDAAGTYVYVLRGTSDTRCQQSSSYPKDLCVYNADGTFVDSYWYALNQGIRLRVTEERLAASDLMDLAQTYATQNGRTYRAALYTFDHSTNFKTVASLSSNLASVKSSVANVDLVRVNDRQDWGCPPTSCGNNNYLFTSFASVLNRMAADLPLVAGKGTTAPGDTPQPFLFIITDGMSDEDIGSGRTRAAMQDAQIVQCNALKARGIQIAIVYTEYTPESIQDDEPYQRQLALNAIPNIAPQLTRCASDGLMYTVKKDQSISAALQALFTKAVSPARLSR